MLLFLSRKKKHSNSGISNLDKLVMKQRATSQKTHDELVQVENTFQLFVPLVCLGVLYLLKLFIYVIECIILITDHTNNTEFPNEYATSLK